jgi:hypothetical protein
LGNKSKKEEEKKIIPTTYIISKMKRTHLDSELAMFHPLITDHQHFDHHPLNTSNNSSNTNSSMLISPPHMNNSSSENDWVDMDDVQDIQRAKRTKLHVDLRDRLATNQQQQQHIQPFASTSSRKRPLLGGLDSSPQRLQQQHHPQQQQQTYTKLDLEKAREEGREEMRQALDGLVTSLKDDRERLLRDQQILKTGVITLNNKRQELTEHLEHTQRQLELQIARYRELENALHMRGIQLGGCRMDSSRDYGGGGGPDVF